MKNTMTKIIKLLACSIVVALVAGCNTTAGLAPETRTGGFDNARTVDISPHGNIPNKDFNMILTGVGAQWTEAHKDKVLLIIAVFNDYTGITDAELNIDGEKIALMPTPGVTDMSSDGSIMKISTKDFETDLTTVEKILNSKRTWLRVHTPTGTMENAIIDGGKDSKAYNALVRFMKAVKGT